MLAVFLKIKLNFSNKNIFYRFYMNLGWLMGELNSIICMMQIAELNTEKEIKAKKCL